jgi:predicted MFS family arabinose efflux permease
LILVSAQSQLAAIQLIYLTAGLLGFSCLYGPLLTTTALWFPERGGVALGIVTMGGTIGQAVVPIVFESLATTLGWREGLACLGLIYLCGIAPLLWFVRKPNVAISAAAAASHAGWPLPPIMTVTLLAFAAMFCCVVMATPLVHVIPLVLASGGDGETASAVMGTMMAAGCISRLLSGVMADRLGALRTYVIVSAGQTAAVCLLIVPPGGIALHAVAAVYGLAFGGVMTGLVCTVKAAVPSAVLGRSMSIVGLAAWVGMGVGGYQGGLCFDLTGDYATSFANAALAGVANLAILAVIGLRLRKCQPHSLLNRSATA